MKQYDSLLALVARLTALIRHAHLQNGLTHAEADQRLLAVLSAHHRPPVQPFHHKQSASEHLISLIGLLEQEHSIITQKYDQIAYKEKEQMPVPSASRNQTKEKKEKGTKVFEVLNTPRAKPKGIVKQSRFEVALKTPSPSWTNPEHLDQEINVYQKLMRLDKKRQQDEVLESQLLESCSFDNECVDSFEKSIQETLERTRKLRKFLDGQLRNLKPKLMEDSELLKKGMKGRWEEDSDEEDEVERISETFVL